MSDLTNTIKRTLKVDGELYAEAMKTAVGDRARKEVEATLGRASDGAVAVPGSLNTVYARIKDSAEEVEVFYGADAPLASLISGVVVLIKRRKNRWEFVRLGTKENEVPLGGNIAPGAINNAPFWVATAFVNAPNAYIIDDVADGLLKHAAGVPALAVVSTDYIAPNTGTNVVNNTMISALAASKLTGQVAVANGGTGASTLTSNNLLVGNGTSAVTFIAPSTSGNILQSNGTVFQSVAPSFNASVITAGLLALARGGTNADLSATGGANQFVKQSSAGAALTVGTIGSSDLTTALTTPPPIGGTTPNTGAFTTFSSKVDANNNASTADNDTVVEYAETSSTSIPTNFSLKRANGTVASPTQVSNGQIIGRFNFQARDNSAYATGAYIEAVATEQPTTTARGTDVRLFATEAGGTTGNTFTLRGKGALGLPTLSGNPSSPSDGDVWFNNTSKRLRGRTFGITETLVGYIHRQVGDVQVNGVTSKTQITSSAPTLAAGTVVAGMMFRIQARGHGDSPAISSLTFVVDIGSVTVLTNTFTLGSTTDVGWVFNCLIGVNSIGATGNVWAQGDATWSTSTKAMPNTAVSGAIDFTASNALTVHLTPSSASYDVHCNLLTIEVL